MRKREWGAGSYRTYSIPVKTAALVPEFMVEDLPSAELQPWVLFCSKGPALGQNTLMMILYIYIYIYIYIYTVYIYICVYVFYVNIMLVLH